MGTDRGRQDWSWSWASLIGASVTVGVGLGLLTYWGFEDGVASIIFGSAMGVVWLLVFGFVKRLRDRRDRPEEQTQTEAWLAENWEFAAIVGLVSVVAVSTLLFFAGDQEPLAIMGLILAIPPLVVLSVSRRRKRS